MLALLHLQAGELDEAQAQARALYRFTPPSFESVMLDYAMAQALARKQGPPDPGLLPNGLGQRRGAAPTPGE